MSRAADVAAIFDGSRLTLARRLAGLRKSELAERVNKSPTLVAGWESGAKRPTPAAVGQIALVLAVDPMFFAARGVAVSALGGTPHFRSLRSTTQLVRDKALAFGQVSVDVSVCLEKFVEFPEVDVPTEPVEIDSAADDAPERAARLVRKAWSVGQDPIRHAVRLLENHGVLIVFSPLWVASVDAYSFDSYRRPVVVLNPAKRNYYRQRFDVAHELGHLVMHSDAEPGGKAVEQQANRFAAEFLMPKDEIRDVLPVSLNAAAWREFAALKEHWGVSIQALLFRARTLERIGDVTYRNAMASISAKGWRRNEPGLMTVVEQPSMLPHAIEMLGREGISPDDLIRQCAVPESLFHTVVARTPEAGVSARTDVRQQQSDAVSPLYGQQHLGLSGGST